MPTKTLINLDEIQQLIGALTQLELATRNEQDAINAVIPHIEKLCSDSDWLPDDIRAPVHEETVHLLHVGDNDNTMILIDTWPGGNTRGCVHDHNTWSVIGCLIGHEANHVWQRLDDGSQHGYCELELANTIHLTPGQVCSHPDTAIHSVDNLAPAGEVSVSLHVYGKDLRTTHRHLYLPDRNIVRFNPNTEFHHTGDH